ncbi:hypothetical protein [Nonomuraea sp. SBT364]|uniref:hypothetical protein n=1 Tax=Nonomuraea sp. SBT364 TaxID=1580530 RepID=UPI00066EEE0D|nr:hypothetical protein [Nonomuraea sp. SBT364]
MLTDDDIEFSRARILAARNAAELSTKSRDALDHADEVRVGSLEVHRGKFPVLLRHYVIVQFSEEYQVVEYDYQDEQGIERVGRRTTSRTIENAAKVWEVQGFLPEVAEMSGSWVYEEATQAASCLAYLLMALLDKKPELEHAQETDLRDLLASVLATQALNIETTTVIPRAPRDELDETAANRNALEARALEAKNSGASTGLRKQIALDLYYAGDTNIRRLAMLTGLARQTVYRALEENGVKRGKNRYGILSAPNDRS